MDHRTKRAISIFSWNRVDDALAQTDENATDIVAVGPDREKYLSGYRTISRRKPAFRDIGLSSMHDLECDDGAVLYKHCAPERDITQKSVSMDTDIKSVSSAEPSFLCSKLQTYE